MARLTVKNNLFMFGWEGAFKKINGTTEAVPSSQNDLDFAINMESFSLSELKPKTERDSKWFVGNSTRKNSYTYDSDFKAGEGSAGDQLKNARPLAMVLGVTSVTSQTTYDQVQLSEGDDRESLFCYFDHGAKRSKAITGCLCKELTIDAKEGEFVTFDSSILTAKMWDMSGSPLTIETSKKNALIDIDREPFHWKHASLKIYDGDPTTGTLNTDFYNLLYETGQAYQFLGLSGIVPTTDDGLTAAVHYYEVDSVEYSFTPTAGDDMSDLVDKLNTATTDNNFVFKLRGSDIVCISLDGSTIDLQDGTTGDGMTTYNLFTVLGNTPGTESSGGGSEFESCKLTITNNTEYKHGAPSSGGQLHANWYKEMLFTVSAEITLYPSVVDDILWRLGPEETNYIDYSGWLLKDELGFELILSRDTHDFIRIQLTKLQIETITEELSNIEAGVDPVTLTIKLAEESSVIDAYSEDPLLHSVSPYGTMGYA